MRPSNRFCLKLLLIVTLAVTLWDTQIAKAAELPQVGDVQLGFDGRYKVGCWTPVLITLVGGSAPVRAELRLLTLDGDGTEVAYVAAEAGISIPAGDAVQVIRYVKFGRVQARLQIQLLSEGRTVASRELVSGNFPLPLGATQRLIVTLGERPVLDETSRRRMSAREQISFAQVRDPFALPEEWIGYESLETLVVTTDQNPLLDQISPRQLAALQRWVRLGGRMVLSVGARGRDIFEGSGSRLTQLARFCPGTFADVTTLRTAAALESYTGASQRLDLGRGRDAGVPLTLLEDVRGRIEVSERGVQGPQPLVVRSPYGFGQVVFLAIDLDGPRVRDWEGRSRLTERLLRGDRQTAQSDGEQLPSRRVAHVGYRDLAGQLRSSLDRFTGVMVVPFFWVAGLIFAYILLLGPGDYLFLQKFVGRPPWTWVTFPLISLLFAGLALALFHGLKEERVLINQIDLVDVDTESEFVRGCTWAHAYSPSTRTYDFRLQPAPLLQRLADQPPSMVLSWQGLPGNGLGGLNTSTQGTPFAPPYQVPMNSAMVGTPIQATSTKPLLARWWGKANLRGSARLRADEDGLLRGEIVNPLPVELTDCALLFANWVYRLEAVSGVLGPGDATMVDLERPLNLEWRLTRRRVVAERDVYTPWDQNDLDVDRVLEMMMFHEAAGGDAYTQLTHRYQAFVDLSHQLVSGRAVLFGKCETPATELTSDQLDSSAGYDRRWTYCRVLVPVENWRREDPAFRTLGTSGS